jgi:hypothetical protein
MRSRTKTSYTSLVSPRTRLDTRETNATYRPSAEIADSKEPSLAGWPLVLTEMRPVVRRARSRMNTPPPWAPATRLDAAESNVTKRPSAEIDGSEASSLIDPPLVGTDTLRVVCDTRSRTNTSYALGSPGTRFDASESKATNRPLAEIDGSEELPLPVRPLVLTDTSSCAPPDPVRTPQRGVVWCYGRDSARPRRTQRTGRPRRWTCRPSRLWPAHRSRRPTPGPTEPGAALTPPDAGATDTAAPDPIAAETADTPNQRRPRTDPESPTMTAAPDEQARHATTVVGSIDGPAASRQVRKTGRQSAR